MKVAPHNHSFEVVWRGSWYRLASLSWHLHRGVDLSKPLRILLDRASRETMAPLDEIHIPPNPIG
jgi:hypothetical protein